MTKIAEEVDKLSVECDIDYKEVKITEISEDMIGSQVKFFGWISKCHSLKKITFFDVDSHFARVKCIVDESVKFTNQTSLTCYGEVVKNKGKDKHLFEIVVHKYEIFQGLLAPSMPVNEDSSLKTKLDQAHLYLRSEKRKLFLMAADVCLKKIRIFYEERDFCEIIPPMIVQTQVEGGATLFGLKYYEENAYLTQSSQLYLETTIPAVGNAFCIAGSFRAESSKTPRHVSEFLHVEGEMAAISFSQLMDHIEQLIRFVVEEFYSKMEDKILELDPNFVRRVLLSKPFLRVSYAEAIDFLAKNDHEKPLGGKYSYGDDIADVSEKFLCKHMASDQPIFLTKFPIEQKPFYSKKFDQKTTETCDLLLPDLGETVGGSMRVDNYDELIDGFKRENLPLDNYYWYTDMAKYGPSPHGGYGIGFERLLMWLMKYDRIACARLYPRTPSRCFP